ncbi:MAG: LemA family protein [Bacteroidales bacterium]
MSTSTIIIIALAVILILFFISMYNRLVKLRNQVKNAWSQIDVQLKRRYDLIPNLIETVKGYMKHEQETLENVTRMRTEAMQASGVAEKAQAEGKLTSALGNLKVAVENYPDLKANQNFLSLQEELTSTENKISFARQNFNDQVLFYNNKIEMFPTNITASLFGFQKEDYFELESPEERETPQVSF